MFLFGNHGRIKAHGWGFYKKFVFLIDKESYSRHKEAFESYMHPEKEDGDYLIGTYNVPNKNIIYLPRYANLEEIRMIKELMRFYFGKTKRTIKII